MLEQQFITFLVERIESKVAESNVANEVQVYIDQLKTVVAQVYETEVPKSTVSRRRRQRTESEQP